MKVFEGNTADEIWQSAANEFRAAGGANIQAGRGGNTKEILHAAFTLNDPRQRWVVSRQPPLNPAFAIADVVWILCGRKDSQFLNYWNTQLPKFAGQGDEYHGAYGYRLRWHFGLDQLERAFLALREDPNSRQVVLQIWDTQVDFPDEQGHPVSEDIPCNIASLLKVRNGKLEWMQVMRSNDLFLGLPHNLIQFTSIQEILAGWLEIEVGSYNQISDSLHLYEADWEKIDSGQPIKAFKNSDTLCLPRQQSGTVLAELNRRIELLITPALSPDKIVEIATRGNMPQAYHNLLLVVAAEGARRRGSPDLGRSLMSSCTSPVLSQVWERWLTRLQQQAT